MIKLSDPDVFDKMASVECNEGPGWAERDRRLAGMHSLTGMIRAWNEYEACKMRWNIEDGFEATVFEHSGVVYGEGGWSRWIAKGDGELVLLGSTTHPGKRKAAKQVGFTVYE